MVYNLPCGGDCRGLGFPGLVTERSYIEITRHVLDGRIHSNRSIYSRKETIMKGFSEALARVVASESSRLATRMDSKEQCRMPSTTSGCVHYPLRFMRELQSLKHELASVADLVTDTDTDIVGAEYSTKSDITFISADGTEHVVYVK